MKQTYAFALLGAWLLASFRFAGRRAPGLGLSCALLLLLSAAGAQAQQRPAPAFFVEDGAAQAAARTSALAGRLTRLQPRTVNLPALRTALAAAPVEGSPAATVPLVLQLPLPDGSSQRFAVVLTNLLVPAVPGISTYVGHGLDDRSATVRLDLTPLGFHAQILSDTYGAAYLDPVSDTDPRHYLAYSRDDLRPNSSRAACSYDQTRHLHRALPTGQRAAGSTAALVAAGATLRTYRLAVAATGEYTAAAPGGTVAAAQARIVTTVNRVTGVYERELAVRLSLINNTAIIFTNPATDPYDNSNQISMANQNQTTLDGTVGTANYDIGHVFSTNGGGVAFVGVVCNPGFKARGTTGSPSPSGDTFDIDLVAHEVGHQFGATHTFNSGAAFNCTEPGNRNGATAYEPGSGSTIMAYAGICSPDDIQPRSDPYFHTASYEQIQAYLATTSCAATTATGNTPPVVSGPPGGKVLPIATPFQLTATGSDADGDALTYCWEQMDLGSASSPTAPQVANDNVPLFRSRLPTASPTRYFPRLQDLVSNTATVAERLPTVTRALTFRVTARDAFNAANGVVGGINNSPLVNLSVTNAAGPFLVTQPNTALTWTGNSTQTVTWSVAGTTTNGVNCATVNIRLSTDGGLTYPTLVLAGTPNDGTQAITVPNVASTTARIMVEAADNYFFDISNTNFTITASTVCDAPTSPSVSSITSSSASVSFTASASASSYTITTTPATSSQTVNTTSATLSGLAASTNYTVNIVSNCAGGTTSPAATASFTTGPAPVVASVLTPTGLTYSLGATIPVTVRFDQAVTVTGAPTLALTIGGTTRQAAYAAAGSSGTDVLFNYVVQSGDLDADGIAIGTLSLNGGSIRNAAATNAVLTLNNVPNTSTVLVDGVAPTATSINRLTPAAVFTNASSVTFRVTFSEAVTGVDAADFSLSTTGTASGSIASISGTGSTRDVVVNGLSGSGNLRLDLNAAGTGISDAAGNASSSGFNSGQVYTLDNTAPNTSIDSGPAAVTTSTSATFTFSGTDNAGGSGVASFEGSLDGSPFAAVSSPTTFTGLSLGSHTFAVRALDALGNVDPTPASYTWTIITAQAAPTVSGFSPTSGPVGTSVSISGTSFIDVTDVSFNGTPASFTVNSTTSITATVPGGATTGTISVTTTAGTATSSGTFTVTLPNLVISAPQTIPGGSYNNVTVTGSGFLSLSGTLSVAGAFVVQSDGGFQTNCNIVTGPGSFMLSAGSTLTICSPAGISLSGASGDIQLSGPRSFSDDATYNYVGSLAQVTGPGLPATVRTLGLSNPLGLTLSSNLGVRQRVVMFEGTLTTTGRVLTLLSNASGTAMVTYRRGISSFINGPITAQRYVDGGLNPGPGYRHFSSPVTNTTFADLTTSGFTPLVNDAYNSAPQPGLVQPFPTLFGYDQSRLSTSPAAGSEFDKGWFSPSALTQPMVWGQGYTANCPAGITPDFVGLPGQTTLVKSNLQRGPQTDAGWHFLGNPYPAPLSWDSLRIHGGLSGINDALYVFRSTGQYAGTYSSYVNGISQNGGGPLLPLAQGFFVRTTTPGVPGQVTFRNSDRMNTPDAPAFQRSSADRRPLLRLALQGSAAASPDETVVYFQAGAAATGTEAALDAAKLSNPAGILSLATQMAGPLNEALAINALPLLTAANPAVRVPLLLTLPAAGTYRLRAAELSNFDPTQALTLVDHTTGLHTDLRLTPEYTFAISAAGARNGRFELWLGRPGSVTGTLEAAASQFSVWPNPAAEHSALHLALARPATKATVTLHNVVGQVVATHSFSGTATDLPTAGLATGTYLLTVQVAGQAATTRRVLVE